MDLDKDVQYPGYAHDENENIDLQRFFSIRYELEDMIKETKTEKSESVKKTMDKRFTLIKKKSGDGSSSSSSTSHKMDTSLVRRYVDCLSNDRCTDYQSWRDVIFVLHSMDPTSHDLMQIAIEFSKRIPDKYQEGCV